MSQDLSELGTHFLTALSGPTLSSREQKLLEILRPVGIILFQRNIQSAEKKHWISPLQNLISSAKNCTGRKHFLVSIDHEGGYVHRLPPPVSHFPPASAWGNHCREVASVMAKELRALSINLSFAPVLDLRTEPQNTLINQRAFSEDPQEAATKTLEFRNGLESQGILSCGKHFPGHGATLTDSHIDLPELTISEHLLRERELIPFRSYIKSQGPLLMTAHARYTHLDPEHPATMSSRIVRQLLRKELDFNGAVISDDLEMAALSAFSLQPRAVCSLGAGVDILLVGQSRGALPLEHALVMAQGVENSLQSGTLAHEDLLSSRARIEGLFSYLDQIQQNAKNTDYGLDCIGAAEHQDLLRCIQ